MWTAGEPENWGDFMSRPLGNDPASGKVPLSPMPEPDDPTRPLRGPAWARSEVVGEPSDHDADRSDMINDTDNSEDAGDGSDLN
jgi:hypothetical protein